MTGKDDRTAGKVKETVGGLTGDHSKKNEGKAQNAGGKVQDKVTDPIKGAAKGVKEAVTGHK